jgi:hypothetical protein
VHVLSGGGTIIYNSTNTTFGSPAVTLNDANFPGGEEFEFNSNTFDNTGGDPLTFEHRGSATGITFRPRFTGSGFNYSGPVVISNGAGTRKTVLESANTSGTQTWSGNMTGSGTFSRLTGGNTVLGGAVVSLGGVSIANNSSIRSAASAGNDHVIRANALTIGATSSTLDISNNKLITQAAVGVATGNTYGGVTGLIQSGRNGGAWNGTTGILTSQSTAAAGSLTTLGIATAQQVKGLATATSTGVWAGQTVTGSDTLVMYTYGGDANLDGKINVDDYGHIDTSIPLGISGWYNGDFNYDGKVNVDDYGIIDFNIGIQGAPFPTAGGASALSGVSAVPEPASLGLLVAACGFANLKRRHRRRHNQ